ncbi:MAG: hypothetical protein L6R41_008282 [Letrouitia leprolyta]|nr:MAG: hypothetical protein L6R41_008282 [Letrouitia leprolyta]
MSSQPSHVSCPPTPLDRAKAPTLRLAYPFCESDDDRYEYSPLQEGEIRLIKMISCPSINGTETFYNPQDAPRGESREQYDTSEMHVMISHMPLREVRDDYTAISYCWGAFNDPKTIFIHHPAPDCKTQNLSITKSLYQALQRATHACTHGVETDQDVRLSWLFWADAICIKQSWEDFDEEGSAIWACEKAAQVLMMGEIYQGAASVLIDLGNDTDDSHLIKDIFWKLNNAAKSASAEGWLMKPKTIIDDELSRLGLSPYGDPSWSAWVGFLARPWFRRVWIVQEYLVASSGAFLLGSKGESLPYLALPAITFLTRNIGFPRTNRTTALKHVNIDSEFALRKLCLWKGDRIRGTQPSLLEGLRDNRARKATDLRDKAYSLLGICAVPRDHPDLRVDYSLKADTWLVFQRFTKWILCNYKNPIEVLYDCGGSSVKKPTWCPEWRSEPETRMLKQFRDNKGLYKAGGISHCELRFDTSLNACRCDGLVVDEIVYLGPLWDGVIAHCYAWEQQTRNQLFKLHSQITGPSPSVRVESSPPSAALAARYVDKNLLEQAYIRTLLGDNLPGSDNTSTCFRKAYDAREMYQLVEDEGEGYVFPKVVKGLDDIPPGSRMLSSFYHQLLSTARGRRLCVMRSGRLALCPARSKKSDVVVILLGAVMPFVMRRNFEYYNMLGGAYIDGIMYGEGLSDSASQVQEVTIV